MRRVTRAATPLCLSNCKNKKTSYIAINFSGKYFAQNGTDIKKNLKNPLFFAIA